VAACGGDDGDDVEIPDVAVAYMEVCNPDLEPSCTAPDGVCYEFGDRGAYVCTQACATADDCPAPSAGCNNKGVCKPP
jgi:hypothetical protein